MYFPPGDRSAPGKDAGAGRTDLPTIKETFEHGSKQRAPPGLLLCPCLGTGTLKATWSRKEMGRCIDHGIAVGWQALREFSGR